MRLERDGIVYELTDEIKIAAFKASGFVEVEAKADRPKRAARKPQAKAVKAD